MVAEIKPKFEEEAKEKQKEAGEKYGKDSNKFVGSYENKKKQATGHREKFRDAERGKSENPVCQFSKNFGE